MSSYTSHSKLESLQHEAARLQNLGVPYIVLEKNPSPGSLRVNSGSGRMQVPVPGSGSIRAIRDLRL